MKKMELVFVPSPGTSHLPCTIEFAKLLLNRDESLSVTIIVIKLPTDKVKTFSDTSRLHVLELPPGEFSFDLLPHTSLTNYIENHKKFVRDVVEKIVVSGEVKIVGFFIDMFCATMIDVANEFSLPCYAFYTSGAASLGLLFHLQSLQDNFNQHVTEFKDSDPEILFPTYVNPVPPKVLPSISFDKGGDCKTYLNQGKRFRETKGIIVNTFLELESHALKALSDDKNVPKIYPVGPILKGTGTSGLAPEGEMIMKWLDKHPPSSVAFLCFGTLGAFSPEQQKEIAYALELSGHRFLWSLRKGSPSTMGPSTEYQDLDDVLPEGFLQRTAEIGKVIGWAPQMAVLSHPAVGGFVSHCGWNSTMESIRSGVPMATWPIYSEQQINAFQLVLDLEMAVEIKMDYKNDLWSPTPDIVTADQIEKGIRQLMDPKNQIRKKVQFLKEKSRMALEEGGSSHTFLGNFIEQLSGKN